MNTRPRPVSPLRLATATVLILLVVITLALPGSTLAAVTSAAATTPVATATTTSRTSAAATATPTGPRATVKNATINVRQGPGTGFGVLAVAKKGETYAVTGRTTNSSWLQLCCFKEKKGWVSAGLVTTSGDIKAVAVPKDMPTSPPSPTAGAASKTPAAGAKPAAAKPAAASALKGVLLYSVVNWSQNRWELWQYTFANGEAKFIKEWRTEVAFSKDYSQVAYFSWGPGTGDKPGICLANPDLSNERMIFVGGPSYPSFSPDGGRLAVQGADDFYIMNADGSGIHPIDTGEYPAWSPVDNWIAHRGCYGADCGLWLTHADSGERRRLTPGGGDGQPAWSPDGQQLAYISKEDGNFEIYKINRDGSGNVRLTNDAHSDGLPVWSPTGDWIAFRSDRSGKWGIYAMRPDGSDVRKIVDADVLPVWFFEKMAWRP